MRRFLFPPRVQVQVGGLWRASGLLLGIWGASCFLSTASRTIHLDSELKKSRHRHLGDLSPAADVYPLAQEKTLYRFAQADPAKVLGRLHEHEKTVGCDPRTGIWRYDTVQLASNNPTEDDHAEVIVPVPNGQWAFFAVLDGHNGWETSAWLRDHLITAVIGSLSDLYSAFKGTLPSKLDEKPTPDPTPEDIESSLKGTFQQLDNDIVHVALDRALASHSRYTATNILAPAYAGSCALLAFYDSHSRLLHVALTGDSRAVLGRRVERPDGKPGYVYDVRELSVDQNGHNPAEESRLLVEHPGELIIKDGRVMGWGTSRAFGDARWKWSPEQQKPLKSNYLGRSTPPGLKTPPYLIAVPEVTCTEIRPGDFLIMATDGLWEALTSEEAVGLVGWWQDNRAGATSDPMTTPTIPIKRLPIKPDYTDTTSRYKQWNAEKVFVDMDTNAGTHLVRNAMGGANRDLASALLSMRAPRSRSYFDDMTVTVVFFGK